SLADRSGPSGLGDRPGGTSPANRLLIRWGSARNPVGEGYGNELPHLTDCRGGTRRRRAGAVVGLGTATGGPGTRLCYERRAGAEFPGRTRDRAWLPYRPQ